MDEVEESRDESTAREAVTVHTVAARLASA
jgi:hypothetical protein